MTVDVTYCIFCDLSLEFICLRLYSFELIDSCLGVDFSRLRPRVLKNNSWPPRWHRRCR